jgi:GxxExxY protein
MAAEILEAKLCYSIVGAFFEVFHYFGPGLPEYAYKKALEIVLRERGHKVVRELVVEIWFKDHLLGTKRLDMVVDDRVIVELKSKETLTSYDKAQTPTYLSVTKFEVGLLLHAGLMADWTRYIDSPKRQHRLAPIARARSQPEVTSACQHPDDSFPH